jgi:hypothetical protein
MIPSRYRWRTELSAVCLPLPERHLPELENVFPVERFARQDHLEAVELGRIVGSGDLQAPVGLQRHNAEIQRRSRQSPDVNRGPASVGDSPAHAFGQCRARRPVVHPHRDDGRASQPVRCHAGEGTPERAGEFRRQLPVDQAANIVLPED